MTGPGGGIGWYGGAASGGYGFSAAGGSGYILTVNSFIPNDYKYKRDYFLRKATMISGVKYKNGAIRITLLYNSEINVLKFRGCGTPGFTFSQIASLITLPSVS